MTLSLYLRSCSLMFIRRTTSQQFWLTSNGLVGSRMASFHIPNQSKQEINNLSTINEQYEEAIKALNGLQSNAAVLEKIKKQRKILMSNNVSQTEAFLLKVGISLDDLDKLPIIHLAGTKGKGSTCAFVESILREQGLKTGFYSSPHLIAVRERIRINGLPIPKKEFSHYFWDVYNTLLSKKSNSNDMPAYFKFLTVLALKIFLKEEVDVAIIEVGIGGEFDCTNVIRRPVVCGITSLDIDHTSCLGETIDLIAWHKAGIIKPNVPVFTVSQQPFEAMSVLLNRVEEKKSKLYVAPPLEKYGWNGKPIQLGLSGYVQFLNASLALQLSRYFLKEKLHMRDVSDRNVDDWCGKPFDLSEEYIYGLQNVVWPGRSQVLTKGRFAFYLDGAHTTTSIQSCLDWYERVSVLHEPSSESKEKVYKILVFNLTGDRDHQLMLEKLNGCIFDTVIFTTNLVTKNMNASSDQTNFTVSEAQQIARCQRLRNFWLNLNRERGINECDSNHSITFQCIRDTLAWIFSKDILHGDDLLAENCSDVLLENLNISRPAKLMEASHVQVLVTGSLHLVGGFLALLDPSLSQPACENEIKQTGNTSMVDMVKRKYHSSRYSTPGAP